MKIGICLSGHYRNFDYNYDSWDKLLFSKYDCDVFLHTWDIIGNRENSDDVNVIDNLNNLIYTQEELKQKYNLKDIVIQPYEEPLQEFLDKSKRVRALRNSAGIGRNKIDYTKRRVTHLYSMWYKALRCFELMEVYNTKYDLVIKCRPDIRLADDFSLDEIDPDAINWPWYNAEAEHYSEPHDYYAVGNFKNMRVYNNLYNHIEEMESFLDIENTTQTAEDKLQIPGVDRFLNPHTLLFFYIKHMGLKTKKIENHCLLIR